MQKFRDKTAEYLFHQGRNFKAYKYLGAHKISDDQVIFRVFAPNAKRVYITGDFCGWNYKKHKARKITKNGIFACVIENIETFDTYKFVIITRDGKTLLKSDPYAFHTETPEATASKVYFESEFEWQDEKWLNSRCNCLNKPLNIYECNLLSWQKNNDGNFLTYRDLAKVLPKYILKMGYTHVEFMPLCEFPFEKSWGYQPTSYFAPTSRLGTPGDLKYLINALHLENIGVILDWVPAHFPKDEHGLYKFDGTNLYEYDDLLKREHKQWGTHVFDFSKPEVQSFLISSADYWVNEFHFDGLRVDAVASMIYLDYNRQNSRWTANIYGSHENLEAINFLQNLNSHILSENPTVMMIAEESTSFLLVTYPPHDGGLGFTYKWNMGWMNDVLEYISANEVGRENLHKNLTFPLTYAFTENFILPISHDEVVHGKSSLIGKMPGEISEKFANLRVFLMYMMATPGKKLNFMGGELAQFSEWDDQKPLEWDLLEYESHEKHQNFTKALNHFYKNHDALWGKEGGWDGFEWILTEESERNIYAFKRKGCEDIICLLNFSNESQEVELEVGSEEEFKIIFDSEAEEFGGKDAAKLERTDEEKISIKLAKLSAVYVGKGA